MSQANKRTKPQHPDKPPARSEQLAKAHAEAVKFHQGRCDDIIAECIEKITAGAPEPSTCETLAERVVRMKLMRPAYATPEAGLVGIIANDAETLADSIREVLADHGPTCGCDFCAYVTHHAENFWDDMTILGRIANDYANNLRDGTPLIP